MPLFCKNENFPELNLKINFVPRRKHPVFVIETDQLILYSEIIAVRYEIRKKKHRNTICGEIAEYINVKPGDTQSKFLDFIK
jgi:hypothetical protein